MNDEIKEMLGQMESISITGKDKNGIKVDGYGLRQNELKILLNYITNLQQENARLKEANKILEENWKHYMMRCGKAIELIKKQKKKMYKSRNKIALFILLKLENILQNGSEEK